MLKTYLAFEPFPLLKNRHAQTLVASQLPLNTQLPSQTHRVLLPDGDQLALEITTPASWQNHDLTLVLVHGLCGSHLSPHPVRMTRKLYQLGLRSVRVNLRGCGSGAGLAKQIYHSGRSEDVLVALADLKQSYPQSPMVLVGFSLGGNLVLKLAGELQEEVATYLTQVIAVCPPANLKNSSKLLSLSSNRLYDQHFVDLLKKDIIKRHQRLPELGAIDFPKKLSLYDFDNFYTAPRCGFRDADDYYARSSAAPLVKNIKIPCRVLFAADDPFIDAGALDDVEVPTNVQIFHTTHGGHLGFLGNPTRGAFYWLDHQLMAWLES